MQVLVDVTVGDTIEKRHVKRAHLRILQAPWAEELTFHMENHPEPVSYVTTKVPVAQPSPVVSPLPPAHLNARANVAMMYRHSATSPLNLNPPGSMPIAAVVATSAPANLSLATPFVTNLSSTASTLTVPVVQTVQTIHQEAELRRKHYDDFVDSDDDLRKEDILFPSENGEKYFLLLSFLIIYFVLLGYYYCNYKISFYFDTRKNQSHID
jgi:hypothetical protein